MTSGTAMTDSETDVVRLTQNCFVPTIARVDPGTKVTFVNEDRIAHTVTGALYVFGDMEGFSKGEQSYRFAEEGIYPYVCILHPGMAGAIVVGDGKGDLAAMHVTDESYANPPAQDDSTSAVDSEAPATEPAAAREPSNQWLLALVVLVGIAIAGATWLSRRKTPQLEG
jgi:plastocyanin